MVLLYNKYHGSDPTYRNIYIYTRQRAVELLGTELDVRESQEFQEVQWIFASPYMLILHQQCGIRTVTFQSRVQDRYMPYHHSLPTRYQWTGIFCISNSIWWILVDLKLLAELGSYTVFNLHPDVLIDTTT